MSVWVIIILGLVQGASEFLPISSSGHLVLFYNIFKVEDNTILLSVILHVATLLAVLVCYRKQIFELIKHPFCETNKKLIVATIPTVIIVLLLKNLVEQTFSGDFIIVGFIITAIVLLISQMMDNKSNKQQNNNFVADSNMFLTEPYNITNLNVSYKQALLIGTAQGIAIFPGISRSGSTIATSLIAGVKKRVAADFSFLLSIPIIIGGLLFEVLEVCMGNAELNINFLSLGVGFLFSFLSGLLCINLMLKFVKKQKLTWFSFYLVLLSLFLVLNKFVFHLF